MDYALEVIEDAIDGLNRQCCCVEEATEASCWACVEQSKLYDARETLLAVGT